MPDLGNFYAQDRNAGTMGCTDSTFLTADVSGLKKSARMGDLHPAFTMTVYRVNEYEVPLPGIPD